MFRSWLGREIGLLPRPRIPSVPKKKLLDWLRPQPNNTFGMEVDHPSMFVTVRVSDATLPWLVTNPTPYAVKYLH
jgi:hypothetical protein